MEPAIEPVAVPAKEPAVEPVMEQAAEPAAVAPVEPAAEPVTEPAAFQVPAVQVPAVTVQAPAMPQTDAFDCWLLAPEQLDQAVEQGLCRDAFARAPEIASLPDAPPPPALTPPRKPKVPERRTRTSSRNSSHSESHAMGASAARVSRNGGGDFFSNFQRDFRALTDLIGGQSSPRRTGGDSMPGSHTSHRN